MLMDPPDTLSSTRFVTGSDSPVKLLSSTDVAPSTTTPSAATLSPVLTVMRLPTGTLSAGTTTISFVMGWITLAWSGRREMMAPRALRARAVALISRNSETANRNDTLAASSNSSSANAPTAAVTIMQLASN